MKSIFITGGARGIGLETAKLFLAKNWRVGIFDQDTGALKEVSDQLNHDELHLYQGSILEAGEVQKAMEQFADEGDGSIDLLHNNAGILEVGEFAEQALQTHMHIVDVNLKGLITATYVALPFLRKSKAAKIINMSSASAIYGNPEITTYAATKSAIMSLTEGWSIAFKKYNISVCDILPIYVRTRMVDDYYQKYRNLDLKSVRLTPQLVAEKIMKASKRSNVHHYVGLETKIYARLVNLLPDSWLPGVLRFVLKYKD